MRRNGIWQLIRNDIRSSARSRVKQRGKRKRGNGFWQGVGDTVLFKPYKSVGELEAWKSVYRAKRIIRNIERGKFQPESEKDTWLGRQKRGLIEAWYDFVDEVKALLTQLFFHVVTLVMIVVFNVAWFAFLFWLIGVWLER
jgi:hypothetical protein